MRLRPHLPHSSVINPAFAAAALLAMHSTILPPPPALADVNDILSPPAWVTTDNGAALKKQSDENSKLPKAAKRVFDAGVELAARGAVEESQLLNDGALQKAEERFSMLIEGEEGVLPLAPNYYGSYTNRANVRVARKNYAGAVDDYTSALRLAPLADDVWVTLLNRGSTYVAMGRTTEALEDLQRAVQLSKSDRYTLLGRGGVYHSLSRYGEAAADYGAVVTKFPADIQPFWVRYALDLFETGNRLESLGIARRTAAKFDLEPECNLAVCSLLWRDGSEADRSEALNRWKGAPLDTKRRMMAFDTSARDWPPSSRESAKEFLAAVPPLPDTP